MGGLLINRKMNIISEVFNNKRGNILSVYFTAGFPKLEDTPVIMKSLQKAGADLIEVGIPFSDPVADGPTIQESNKIALDNGITLKKILKQLNDIKNDIQVPVILMGYLNPIYQYGFKNFCKDCLGTGVSGLIIPDLPVKEYLTSYKSVFERYGLVNIFLITPQTSEQRIREIDQISNAFIYMVSSASTTGAKKGLNDEQIVYFKRISEMQLKSPLLIGFGISDHESFMHASSYADGAIIGSAFIEILRKSNNLEKDIIVYVQNVKGSNLYKYDYST
jgi:tryptophan synthase alpha chain